jgi:hypothetical protein
MIVLGFDPDGNIVLQSGNRYAIYACDAKLQPTTLLNDCGEERPPRIFAMPPPTEPPASAGSSSSAVHRSIARTGIR